MAIEQIGGNNNPTVTVEKGNTISDVLGKGLNRKVKYTELVVGSLELQSENPMIRNVNLIEVGMEIKIPENLSAKIQAVLSNPMVQMMRWNLKKWRKYSTWGCLSGPFDQLCRC